MSNITENDVRDLIHYMKAIIQLIAFCVAMKTDYKKIMNIESSLIAQKLPKKINSTSQLRGPLELQLNLLEHTKIATIINSNIFFFDTPADIDRIKYDACLAKIFETPMSATDTTRTYTSHSMQMRITYKEIYEGKYKDPLIVSMLNTLGNPYKEGGFGRNQFELIVSSLLKHLQLNSYEEEKNLDYASFKFYLMTDLLFQFVTNLKTTADFILHHYQIAYLWYLMAVHLFNQTPRDTNETITDEAKKMFMQAMNDLTGSIESFWNEFPALKHLSGNIEIKKIYDNYSYETHESLENKNNGLKDKVALFEAILLKIQQWQARFEDNMGLIPPALDQEAGDLVLLLLTIHSKLKNNNQVLIKSINTSSTLIIEKLKTINRDINTEMESNTTKNKPLSKEFFSPSVKSSLTHGRSKSFSGLP